MEDLNIELQEIINDSLGIDISVDELEDLDCEMSKSNDFSIEINGCEYRFISENTIEDVYFDEQKDLIEDCYLGGKELPWWFEIDWGKTIDNVLSSDGYGNHFSGYDGSEETFGYDGEVWYVFRTN
jgi:hypothetical protein